MCRAAVQGFIKISDKKTPGKIVMHKGTAYRVPENETWGSKFEFIKKHPDATFVTKFTRVKKKLKKHFPGTEILLESSIKQGMRVSSNKVIFLDYGISRYPLETAWGKNLRVIELDYFAENVNVRWSGSSRFF